MAMDDAAAYKLDAACMLDLLRQALDRGNPAWVPDYQPAPTAGHFTIARTQLEQALPDADIRDTWLTVAAACSCKRVPTEPPPRPVGHREALLELLPAVPWIPRPGPLPPRAEREPFLYEFLHRPDFEEFANLAYAWLDRELTVCLVTANGTPAYLVRAAAHSLWQTVPHYRAPALPGHPQDAIWIEGHLDLDSPSHTPNQIADNASCIAAAADVPLVLLRSTNEIVPIDRRVRDFLTIHYFARLRVPKTEREQYELNPWPLVEPIQEEHKVDVRVQLVISGDPKRRRAEIGMMRFSRPALAAFAHYIDYELLHKLSFFAIDPGGRDAGRGARGEEFSGFASSPVPRPSSLPSPDAQLFYVRGKLKDMARLAKHTRAAAFLSFALDANLTGPDGPETYLPRGWQLRPEIRMEGDPRHPVGSDQRVAWICEFLTSFLRSLAACRGTPEEEGTRDEGRGTREESSGFPSSPVPRPPSPSFPPLAPRPSPPSDVTPSDLLVFDPYGTAVDSDDSAKYRILRVPKSSLRPLIEAYRFLANTTDVHPFGAAADRGAVEQCYAEIESVFWRRVVPELRRAFAGDLSKTETIVRQAAGARDSWQALLRASELLLEAFADLHPGLVATADWVRAVELLSPGGLIREKGGAAPAAAPGSGSTTSPSPEPPGGT